MDNSIIKFTHEIAEIITERTKTDFLTRVNATFGYEVDMNQLVKALNGITWVSVDDELPAHYGEYMVAWLPKDWHIEKRCFMSMCEYEPMFDGVSSTKYPGKWLTANIEKQWGGAVTVYAWMELPERYVVKEAD